ncbi:MAG: hypothetical protein HY865_02405 [Chloroflexi bacterium]|nr:hypothetical protein [Chloroflexota bacterium]
MLSRSSSVSLPCSSMDAKIEARRSSSPRKRTSSSAMMRICSSSSEPVISLR